MGGKVKVGSLGGSIAIFTMSLESRREREEDGEFCLSYL